MGFVKNLLLLALIVHLKDSVFPVWIRPWYPKSDGGVPEWNSLAYGSNKGASVCFVGELVGELGFLLKLAEVDVGQVAAHLQFIHLFLMDELDGRVTELLSKDVEEVVPSRVLVARPGIIVPDLFFGGVELGFRWHIPIVVPQMDPLVFCVSF